MADNRPDSGLPRSIEQILAVAAKDPSFRNELLADRKDAIERRNYRLSDTDKELLDAVPPAQLRALLDALSKQDTLVTGSAEEAYCGGIRPGLPPDFPFGPPAGIRPDRIPPVRGTRPGRVVAAAATAAALAGGGYLAAKHLACRESPDEPPSASPAADPGPDPDPDPDAGPTE